MRATTIILGLGLAAALASCGKKADEAAAPASGEASAPAAAEPTAAEKQAAVATLPAPYNAGDLANGEKVFLLCRSCHTITQGGPNMTGPNLHGLFGRKAGTAADFNYSDAVKNAGFTWDVAHLDQWLTSPASFLPGTKMTFMGVKDPKDRVDVIAYLKAETSSKPGT